MFFTRDMLIWGGLCLICAFVFLPFSIELSTADDAVFYICFLTGYLFFIFRSRKTYFSFFIRKLPVFSKLLEAVGWISYAYFAVLSFSSFFNFFGQDGTLNKTVIYVLLIAFFGMFPLGLASLIYHQRTSKGMPEEKVKGFVGKHLMLFFMISLYPICFATVTYL